MATIEQQIAVPTGTWQGDVVHSSLGFEVQYMGVAAFRGAVEEFNASLADGALTGAGRIASLETKDENLKAHLLSPEFFDAERHPDVTFAGRLVAAGDGIEVDGQITIKGITRPTVLKGTQTGPITDPYGNARYGLQLQTTIDRTEFGIEWNADMPDGTKALADDVTLKADLSLLHVA